MAKISIKKYTDPYINNVCLFLPFNSNFNDNSKNNSSVTAYGNPQISSTQSKFGGASAYFHGYGDYLDVSNLPSDYLSQDFTIEAWVWIDDSKYNSCLFNTFPHNSFGVSLNRQDAGRKTSFGIGNGTYWYAGIESDTLLSFNTWQHIAFVRSNNTITLYENGIARVSTNYLPTGFGTSCRIGSITWIYGLNNEEYKGYMQDFRITKGIARYTSNFTPRSILPNNDKLNIKKIIEGSQVSSLSGLSLWLKADAGVTMGGGNVNTWADQSPNGNNATGPATKKPTFVSNGINGKPAMSFNGTTQLFTINDSNSLDLIRFSIYVVLKRNANGTGNEFVLVKNPNNSSDAPVYYHLAKVNGSNSRFIAYTTSGYASNIDTLVDLGDGAARIMSFIYNGTTNDSYVNGIKTDSTYGYGDIITSTGSLQIGGSDQSLSGAQWYFNGYISEIIIFNRALNTTEHLSVTNYLNDKYALYTSSNIKNGKLKILFPELSLDQIFLRLESDKNITLNGSNVSAWGDLSGGTRNFSQAADDNQPIFLNGGLEFQASQQYNDSNADYMENTNNPSDINNITGPYTFAVVANLNLGLSTFINASSNNPYRRKLSCYYYNDGDTSSLGISNGPGDGYGSSISNPPIDIGQKNIIIIRVVSNTQVDYFINNTKISQNDANLNLNPGITTPTPLYLGAARGFGGGGYNAEASWGNPVIYDLFLYNKSLTESEVVALKYYLNNKHGIY